MRWFLVRRQQLAYDRWMRNQMKDQPVKLTTEEILHRGCMNRGDASGRPDAQIIALGGTCQRCGAPLRGPRGRKRWMGLR